MINGGVLLEGINFRRKIGILGGTFNPIHNGHLFLAKTALTAEELDEVILMPTGKSYLKSKIQMPDAQKRFEMIKLAIENEPFLTVSDMEINRPGNTYTFETLIELKTKTPDTNFYFIICADNLFSIEYWKKPEVIFRHCILLVAERDQTDTQMLIEKSRELEKKFGAKIHILPFKNTPISSTQIRERIISGQSIDGLVPQSVEAYIKETSLYQDLEI